ncbi:hypothetical protein PINS_up009830 [Pythium insidiosum]|nr:hypothetical protein PINS_up009830 [Pythium insidiosum]
MEASRDASGSGETSRSNARKRRLAADAQGAQDDDQGDDGQRESASSSSAGNDDTEAAPPAAPLLPPPPAAAAAPAPAAAAAPAPEKRRRGRRRLIHDEALRKDRRKAQCKLNQRRYRARQRGMITTLSLEAEQLSDSIRELAAYRDFLVAFDRIGTGSQGSTGDTNRALLLVEQFFVLFRDGFALHSVQLSEIQERFLRFAMDPEVCSQGATQSGIDALTLQLKRYTSYHAVFAMHVESLRLAHAPSGNATDANANADGCTHSRWIVRAAGSLHLRLSRDSVILLFPHIVDNEELTARVVGHEINPPFAMVFYFNERDRVSRLEFHVDLVPTFVRLLQSTHDAALLMERAIITPLSELGVDPHGAQLDRTKANKQLSLKFILL